MATSPASKTIYQLKVTLKGFRPPIWRRLQVRGDTRLSNLHTIIQCAMGWQDYHLHEFKVGKQHYWVPDPDDWHEVLDERKALLGQVAPAEKVRFAYEYDFGDSWEHEILVEKILPPETGAQYPRCVTGKRACPPEDVGGVWGYAEFLEAIGDPDHEEHERLLEWAGGSFDSDAFDLDEVNTRLRELA
ncbi:MAG TPA: plasmid pRiA4b ORF-3 family protein [Dehalococcoidia bacterium]|nr:plasmid pRiA4b ORF-3 family protein [Dehalococcoidia bacterium]